MVRAIFQRPSVLVGGWMVVVVGVFVWRGDLRIDAPAGASARQANETRPPASPPPTIVRAPAPSTSPRSSVERRTGRVFDALGFLVVGAEVVPMHQAPMRTDGDGTFALDFAAMASTDVLVRADGQQPRWVRLSRGSPDALALQLLPGAPWDALPSPPSSLPTLRGEGTVRTADGRPLAGAFVTASGSGLWARTDDIGRFAVPLPSPAVSLLVHEPDGGANGNGFAATSAPIVPEREQGAVPLPDLIATPALAIRGIVRDAAGHPVVGVPVEIGGASMRRVVDTGPGGAFRCGGLVPGRYQVWPFSFRGSLGVPREVTLADAAVDVDMQLVAATEVRLRVVDERGGPVSGVYVASNVGGARRGVARADAEGYAAVPVATATTFDVHTATDYAQVPVRRFEEPATLVVAMP